MKDIENQLQGMLNYMVDEDHDSMDALVCSIHTRIVGRVCNWLRENRIRNCGVKLSQHLNILDNRLDCFKITLSFQPHDRKRGTYELHLKAKPHQEQVLRSFVNKVKLVAFRLREDYVSDSFTEKLSEAINEDPDKSFQPVRYFIDYSDATTMHIDFQVKEDFEIILKNEAREKRYNHKSILPQWAW